MLPFSLCLSLQYPDCHGGHESSFPSFNAFLFPQRQECSSSRKLSMCVYGDKAVSKRTVCEWFVKFRQGELGAEDGECSGRPVEDIDDHIKALIPENHQIASQEIRERLEVSRQSMNICGDLASLVSLLFGCCMN